MKIENAIIGFGKAGKTLAAALGAAGQKTVLIEKSAKMYGGTCINIACIPTKYLREQALKGVPFTEAIKQKNVLVENLREKNYEKTAEAPNVEIINGSAAFTDANTIEITDGSGAKKLISAEKIFINTGTLPFMPPIEGIETKGIYDSTGIMELRELPKNLLIVGGGFIGIEFAGIFAAFGSKVTLMDQAQKFLGKEDDDVAKLMEDILSSEGVSILMNSAVKKFEREEDSVKVTYSHHNDEQNALYDAVLIATGRKPSVTNLNPQNARIETDEKGFIKTNSKLQSSKDHIWALGDINGGPQFTYISLDDFRIVKNQLLNEAYDNLYERKPFATTVFSNPPFSHIGKKENETEGDGLYLVKKISAATIPKAKILGEERGFLKAIVNKETKKIEGCTLFCAKSDEMINTVKTVMDAGLPYTVLRDQVFTHPTMTEALNDLFDVDE